MSPRQEGQFRIGDAFPADDPIARWITVLAMAGNDFLRLFAWMDAPASDDESGTQTFAYRLIAATYYEAARHLTDAQRCWPKIKTFVDGLDDDAKRDALRVCESIDEKSHSYLGPWVKKSRDVTFHYAEVHPKKENAGNEEIKQALRNAADLIGVIVEEAGRPLDTRFGFADDVAVQWLPCDDDNDARGSDPMDPMVGLREACLALQRFTRAAIAAYMAKLPEGVIEVRDAGAT